MGDEYMKEDRQVHKEIFCEPRRDRCCEPIVDCEPECKPDCRRDPCKDEEEGGFATWLPIILIVLLFCGGGNLFGGRDDGCDNGGFGGLGGFGGGGISWILILVVIFCLCGNKNGRDGGGFLGGLF